MPDTSSFHFHGVSDLQYVLFLLLRVFFFNLVCNPMLILQISGTFQQTCRKLHRKAEEADNAVKVVLSKLSSCCDKLGKMDLDDSTLKACVVIWLHRWKLLSGMRWNKYQQIRLTFVLPAMICCCCILVLRILRLARSFWSCSSFFDYLIIKFSASPACGKEFGGFGWHMHA